MDDSDDMGRRMSAEPSCVDCTLTMGTDGTPLHARSCQHYTGPKARWTGVGARWRVRCSDGKVRTATVLRDADTFWTLPARVNVKGRTVTGYLYADTLRPIGEWRFSADAWRANAKALPAWPSPDPVTEAYLHGTAL